jgi:hypothetical protein
MVCFYDGISASGPYEAYDGMSVSTMVCFDDMNRGPR